MEGLSSCLAWQQPSWLAMLSLGTTIAMVLVLIANARQRRFFGKDYFLLAQVAMIIWLAGVTLEIMNPSRECNLPLSGFSFFGIAMLPVAWSLYIYNYAFSLSQRLRRLELLGIAGFGLIFAVLTWTNDAHGLMFSARELQTNDIGMQYVKYTPGPGYIAMAVMLYVLTFAALGLLVLGARRAAPQFRLYFIFPVLITMVIIVPNLGYLLFDWSLHGFDPAPFAFAVVVALFSMLIVSNRMFDTVNVGSELIFSSLRAPALIIDGDGQVVAANAVATETFAPLAERVNRPITDISALASAISFASGELRLVPGRRVNIAGRYFDLDAIRIPKPLSRRDEPIGLVLMFNDVTSEEVRYREMEAELASNMQQLESAAALQKSLREAAEFDPLTRVRNRLSLPGLFGHCVEQAGREQKRVGLVVFDIDHFKRWNDLFGHPAGDRVLKDFARFLEDNCGEGQIVFRIGGEEFLLLMPDVQSEQALALVQRMRKALAGAELQRSGDETRLTFSAGVAHWPEDGLSLEALLESADRRLYEAKAAGRDRVVAA